MTQARGSDTGKEERYQRALESRAMKDQADGGDSDLHKNITNGAVIRTGNVKQGGNLVLFRELH